MAWYWRRLALAASAAAALGMTCAFDVGAQVPAKAGAKNAKAAKGAEAPQGEEPANKPAKKKKQDPAQAQQAIDAALKLLEAGKAEQASQGLTAVLSGGNLPPAIMAKALFYRGVAHRQRKMPAQAIADLTSALWLKGGLRESDRADALRQRTSAYQEAGLTEGGQPIAPAIANASHAPTRTASAGKNWSTATISSGNATSDPAPAVPKPTSGGWNLPNPFAGLFGGSSSASPSPAPPSAHGTTASIEKTEPASAPGGGRRKVSSWSRSTEVHSGTAPAVTSAAAAMPEGRFRIQLGIVRSEGQAQAIAAKVKREYGAVLAAREPQIDQAVVGNMGSFYRVRVGPFATQHEGQATCAKLKGSGLDCLVVAQ